MGRGKSQYLMAIVAWQAVSLAMFYVYEHLVIQFVLSAYTHQFGDVQASFNAFYRLNTYLSWLVITAPATIAALFVFNRTSGLIASLKQNSAIFCGWLAIVFALLILSYEFELSYKINQFGWEVFGPPENLYSFQNLVLHRIVAWLLITVPVAFAALWLHRKFADSHSAALKLPETT